MEWQTLAWRWLIHAGFGSLALLGLACLALRWIRQPARQLLLIEWTFAACLAAPWLHLLPGMPAWSLGWLPAAEAPATRPLSEALEGESRRSEVAGNSAPRTAPVSAGENFRRSPFAGLGWPSALVVFYAAGATGVLLHWLLGVVQLVRLQRTAAPAPPLARRMLLAIAGPSAQPALLVTSRRVDTPITFGWRRPIIVLPEPLCQEVGETPLRYALAHEWSHVERRDVVVWHLTALVQLLCFYQPLFWRLRRQLRLCQDFLADARAARQGGEVEDYADYLVALALRRLKAPPAPALAFSDRRSDLYRRVVMLVERRETLERHCSPGWRGALGATAALVALAVSSIRLEADEAGSQPAADLLASSSAVHRGRVTDHDTGRPIEGAAVVVRLREAAGASRVFEESRRRTDADGQYSFSIHPAQRANAWLYLEIDVDHPQYASKCGLSCSLDAARQLTPAGGQPEFAAIRLRRGEEATGIVETFDGRPAANMDVAAYSQADGRGGGRGSLSRTKTDAEGRFRVVLAASGSSVVCLLPVDGMPLLCVVHQQRSDLGRFRLPTPLARREGPATSGIEQVAVDALARPGPR